jgi:hypothetical protein
MALAAITAAGVPTAASAQAKPLRAYLGAEVKSIQMDRNDKGTQYLAELRINAFSRTELLAIAAATCASEGRKVVSFEAALNLTQYVRKYSRQFPVVVFRCGS